MRMCATSVERSSRVTTSLPPPGESDPWMSLWFCLTGWGRACLQKGKPLLEWRWSWKMVKWTLWRTGSNTCHITGQETHGKTLCFTHMVWFCFLFLCHSLFVSCVQVHIPHVWLHTLSMWLHWAHHTLTVHQRVSGQVCHSTLMHFIRVSGRAGYFMIRFFPIHKHFISLWLGF